MSDTPETASPDAKNENPYLIPAAIVLAGVFVAVAILVRGDAGSGTVAPTGRELTAQVAPVTADDHVFGPRDADVFLIEYSDYQCPFCTRFHATVKTILEEYDGRVAWVYRHFPLDSIHPEARPAAIASECIAEYGGNEAFWGFTNAVFERNLTLSRNTYLEMARELGVDEDAFTECIDEQRYNDLVNEQMENAQAVGGTGTPYNILLTRNGDTIKFAGAQPIERVRPLVERALESL